MKSLKIDIETNSLKIPFEFVTEQDKVKQDLSIRLKTFWKEWFLDQRKGVKYKELIFEKYTNESKKSIENHLRSIILDTKDIISIVSYTQVLNSSNLNSPVLEVNFTVSTTYGIITINESLKIL